MPQLFSLAHLTLLALPPPELIAVAAGAGYGAVGLRLLPSTPGGVAYPLMDDPALLRKTLARSQATGVAVFDLEVVRLNAEFDVASHLAFFETGALPALLPVSVEIPSITLSQILGGLEWARQALVASKAVLQPLHR